MFKIRRLSHSILIFYVFSFYFHQFSVGLLLLVSLHRIRAKKKSQSFLLSRLMVQTEWGGEVKNKLRWKSVKTIKSLCLLDVLNLLQCTFYQNHCDVYTQFALNEDETTKKLHRTRDNIMMNKSIKCGREREKLKHTNKMCFCRGKHWAINQYKMLDYWPVFIIVIITFLVVC